jgi:hypothetical protein
MEMVEVKKRRGQQGVLLLRVNKREALELIQSLTEQMLSGSPNAGRLERFLPDGRDFSIAVHSSD